MSSRTLILQSDDRLKASDMATLISDAMYPDDIKLFSDKWFNDNGDPLIADEPFMMRFITKPRIEKDIRSRFESGELKLICPITQGPVLSEFLDRTNPFDCLISFDNFVDFAKEYQVEVVSKENSVDTHSKLIPVDGDDDENGKGRRDSQIDRICEIAKQFNYELLSIPEGGKVAIKTECLKDRSLFSDAAFDHAWKTANRRGVISMRDKIKYL